MRVLITALTALVTLAAIAGVLILGGIEYYRRDLPDYRQLANYEPAVATRVYAGDGRLLAEFATERRVFLPIAEIPAPVIDAFLSAEDKTFYSHHGIDPAGVLRAVMINLENLGTGRRLVGASTITQQVAKNMLLSNEVSFDRKIREAILAVQLDQTFSKERILELYLNEIYLGRGSYGVAAAALNYFDKSVDRLTLAEAAFLAALPKAPNNYDPDRQHDEAVARRNWVLQRMVEDGRISAEAADEAMRAPLLTGERQAADFVDAAFFAEDVRRVIAERYGDTALYEGGLTVHTTLDPKLQALADRTLRNGLEAYDRRHGWRGPIARIDPEKLADMGWKTALDAILPPAGIGDRHRAVVLDAGAASAKIGLDDGRTGSLALADVRWARPWRPGQRVGQAPGRVSDVVSLGDVIIVSALENDRFRLEQIPAIDGALIALDPHTGRVLAISGGYTHERTEFNRATQAQRQPGSAFKPFVYLAALEQGYPPTTIILDAPVEFEQGPGLPTWKPQNYSERFYGPTTMRVGLEKSRNVMTVRLANEIGMERVADVAKRFGIIDNMPPLLAYALGAGETTPLKLTTAYAMLVNGGRRIVPSFIDRIQDRYGHTIYRHDPRECVDCRALTWNDQAVPQLAEVREQVTDPFSAYQAVSFMEGVVERGTGKIVSEVGKPLAGKTGTSNEARDTWFVGFSPDLAVGVFVGFDEPASLGPKETGGGVAAPIFRDFMEEALADTPAVPFRIPPDIRLVRVNAKNGRLTDPSDPDVILEAFKPENVPLADDDRIEEPPTTARMPSSGTGGLY
jgi:penicillin-binding protein 1A